MRPNDVKSLKGDASKARKELGWRPEYNFYKLLDEMIRDIGESSPVEPSPYLNLSL